MYLFFYFIFLSICSFIYLFIYLLVHSFPYLFTYSFIHPSLMHRYRAPFTSKAWIDKFKHVIGIIHTNYLIYTRGYSGGVFKEPLLYYLNQGMCRANCHKIIKLSGMKWKYERICYRMALYDMIQYDDIVTWHYARWYYLNKLARFYMIQYIIVYYDILSNLANLAVQFYVIWQSSDQFNSLM